MDEHGRPSVDVVLATRDRVELLTRALRSIQEQDYDGDVRSIVVFDGPVPREFDEAAFEAPRRHVVVRSNQRTPGLAGGRNTGLDICRADYVAFCDDDDEWLPDKLLKQLAVMKASPDVVLVSSGIIVVSEAAERSRPAPTEDVRLGSLLRRRIMELHPSTFLFRRSLLAKIGTVDESLPGSYAEDYDLLLRAARCGPVRAVRDPLVRVHWHGGSHFFSRWIMIADALERLLDKHAEFAAVPEGRARILGQIAFARAAAGQRRAALRLCVQTWQQRPAEPRTLLALAVASGVVSADRVQRLAHARGRGI